MLSIPEKPVKRIFFYSQGDNIVYSKLMDYKKPDIYLVKLAKIPAILPITMMLIQIGMIPV